MQGIGIKLANVEEIKKQFSNLIKDLQDKANKSAISISVADFSKLDKQLKEVEKKVNESTKNISNMTKKAFQGADTGNTYQYFTQAMNKVSSDIKKNGGQISDVLTKVDEKTKAITGATIKYTDALGKAKTEYYELDKKFKTVDGKQVLDKVDLKLSNSTYDNNIAKQQSDNYSKLNGILAKIKTLKTEISKLDKDSVGGSYALKLQQQLKDNESQYTKIINSTIKINDEEKTSAINKQQINTLLEKRKTIEDDIARSVAKQNDPTLRKTSTTTSGQRDLGELVPIAKPVNFNASSKELSEYARAIGGINAEWTKMTPKIDGAGNKIKEVSVRVKEGSDKWHNYQMTIDETTGKLYKIDRGLSDVSSHQMGFIQSTKIAITRIAEWGISTMAVYGTLQKLREGLEFISSLNKSTTNIKMIANLDDNSIKEFTKDISDMADNLYTTTDALSQASEEYLRAGHNIEETKNLLKSTQIASAISGQDAKAVSEQLIAITNGFGINVAEGQELMKVIDTLSALDNSSATSFKELSTAMQYTSASAKNVGMSITDLSTYIATVSSVTRRSAETIGQSFKTIFSRFEDIKQGKEFDSENEPLSNVEASLNKVGIAIRKDKDTFRDFNDVLLDLSKVWNSGKLSDISKADITKSLAGGKISLCLL